MFQFDGKCIVRQFQGDRAVSDDANAKAKLKIKLLEVTPADAVGFLLCEENDIWGGMFGVHEEGKDKTVRPAFPGVSRFVLGNTWENMHTIKLSTLPKHQCLQFKVVSCEAQEGGHFEVEAHAVIERPGENFLETLAERCNREIPCKIVQTQQDLFEQPAEEAAEEQADAFPDKPTEPTRARKTPSKAAAKRKAMKEAAKLDKSQVN